MSGDATVFVIDDQPEVRELLAKLLERRGRTAAGFADGDRALAALAAGESPVELVVLDLDLGPGRRDGLAVLADLRRDYPELPCVILTGKGTVEDAVRAMQLGATDFVEKDPRLGERLDVQMDKLDRLLAVLRDNRRLKQQNRLLRRRAGLGGEMVGADGGLRAVTEQLRALAPIPRPVLITGERGTGKELVAIALHRLSDRAEGPFVTLNCAALPDSLAEAELFGHARGAFTDAREARPGKFELADGGTLFLDEVGNMPLGLQQKLLRVIEYQTFERVGGGRPRTVDVRLTAATNADLQRAMQQGEFRRDLYDRLAFDTIRVPPLRERRKDIPALCAFFLDRFREEVGGLRCSGLSPAALEALQQLELPGNVRELKNRVERAAYRCQRGTIEPADLDLEPGATAQPAPVTGDFRERVQAFERELLGRAIDAHGTLGEAARALGLGYDQMRRLAKKHGLRPGRREA
jgi:DNA-binding NtrC family response regulator